MDPGGDPERIIEHINKLGVKITRILITHAHFDHFLAAGEMRKHTGAKVYLHPKDKILWGFLPMQLNMMKMRLSKSEVEVSVSACFSPFFVMSAVLVTL